MTEQVIRKNPLISVVTPVYNGEKHLSECIESVLRQTFSDWEYLILDNRSTDRTPEIAAHYAALDSRIRVCRNEKTVSMARNHNLALRMISPASRYCKIVHADDQLFPECLEKMVAVAERNPSVGVVSAYGLVGTTVKWAGIPFPCEVVAGREVCRKSLSGNYYVFGSPTSHLLRADLVRKKDRFYNEHRFHRQFMDVEACYELLQESDFGFVHQVLTYTRLHDHSATSTLARQGLAGELPSRLNMLRLFGRGCLTESEFKNLEKRMLNSYYRFLGRNILRFREKEFREFHLQVLRYLGYTLEPLRLIGSALGTFAGIFVHIMRRPDRVVTKMTGLLPQRSKSV